MATRPLAKALHTVTSCARVAAHLRDTGCVMAAKPLTYYALAVLGYNSEQVDASPALRDACIAAVARALAVQS